MVVILIILFVSFSSSFRVRVLIFGARMRVVCIFMCVVYLCVCMYVYVCI